uniref:Uncharacterized protein n=1 Tax=Panagrolaimus davidi TaxID=227884 RepID=A0A914PW02_9BILA
MSKPLVVFISPREDKLCFNLVSFNLSTRNEVPCCTKEVHDLLKFFEKPPEFITKNVKAIVCNINGFYKNGTIDHEFCSKLATKLKNLKIPFRFISRLHTAAMCTFVAAKVDPKIDKEALQIDVQKEIFKLLSFSRSDEGYVMTKVQEYPKDYNMNVLLGQSNPTKIIIVNASPLFPVSSELNPIIFHSHNSNCLFDAGKELVDHMFHLESSKKYFVIPQALDKFGVSANGNDPSDNDILLKIKGNEYLPAAESCVVSRFHRKFFITGKSGTKNVILQGPIEITKECHRIKLTLSVDLNNYPSLIHEAVILSKVSKMPKKLKTEKLPIIGFFDNSSVICLWNETENCYKFMDSWNGKFGKDLFVDFLLPKPTIVASSTGVTSLAGAVYDLIKIMSMPSTAITIDDTWKFTFTEDDENPILLEFDTFEKSRKQASPAFLMALMLKEHIRAIKKETVKKPIKLGFRLLDEFENPEARKRVEAGLEEACGMIKIGFLLV